MFCHNAYPDVAAGSDRFGEPESFPHELPHGIGCQRCHGPGLAHAELASDLDADPRAVRDTIVNPAHLDAKLREDVCLQCHLQPTVKLTAMMRQFGRSHYSYRPGEPLVDYLVHFDAEVAGEDVGERFEINHHPYRLFQSACYTSSAGEMSCLTCHDPHRKVPADQRAEYYRDRCLTCHQPDHCNEQEMQLVAEQTGMATGDCAGCHMGQRVPTDVTHVVMTDHKIQRRPPSLVELPAAAENYTLTDPEIRFYDDRSPQSRLMADACMAVTLTRSHRPDKRLLREAIELLPQIPEPYWYLGSEELADKRYGEAEAAFARAIELLPERAWPHLGLGKALQRQGQHLEALPHFRKAAEFTPGDPEVHLGLGRSLRDSGQTEAAERALQEAIRLRAHYAEAIHELGSLHARGRQFQKAEPLYRKALAIEPAHRAAAADLGAVLMYLGRFAEAAHFWRHGAEMHPDDYELREWLAQLYLTCPDGNVRDLPGGQQYAEAALAKRPGQPSAVATLALARLLNERYEEAMQAAEKSRELGADPANALLITTIALKQLGRASEAQQTYAKAQRAASIRPSGDAIRQLLLRLAAVK